MHGGETAAFVFEPLVQGSAGMVMYPADALKAMCDLCQRYGVLLIADEVMTGFGRTGTMFACNAAGVNPDLMALSKGLTGGFLPMGATLATRAIYDAFYATDRAKTFMHSTSFTANPIACAAALAALQVWEDEDTQGKIDAIADTHRAALSALEDLPHLGNARAMGSVLAVDVRAKTQEGYLTPIAPQLMQAALAQNVLLRPIGNVIYILPPYCTSAEDLQRIYALILEIAATVN